MIFPSSAIGNNQLIKTFSNIFAIVGSSETGLYNFGSAGGFFGFGQFPLAKHIFQMEDCIADVG